MNLLCCNFDLSEHNLKTLLKNFLLIQKSTKKYPTTGTNNNKDNMRTSHFENIQIWS